ncbi:MAG: putative DNA binding domain-containing protein [Firmicutes bacterium]|nr:putative DNA binding domain-containing protein [Bacillota bacterium]
MKTAADIRSLLLKGEKIDLECKEAEKQVPRSIYETYSAFANTDGGTILLGVQEDKSAKDPAKRFLITGVADQEKLISDFWNTINGSKVNVNILIDENVYPLEIVGLPIVVIEVPRADYMMRPVHTGENPFKGSFKRNHEGDYHCSEAEVRAMIRDQNESGNDSLLLDYYTMDDIDLETLHRYRNRFRVVNGDNVWNALPDKEFLEVLGGYRYDRRKKAEGLTMAGLLMFGKGLPIRDVFDMINMDYREETDVSFDVRWNDRVTYDGTWENNLFNFIQKVMPKLTSDLPKPFRMEGILREDDTPQHKACREAMINMIIHADFQGEGTLKVIKRRDRFEFTNPGILKIPKEMIYKGGNSKARNPRMQTMLRMIGYGDTAGSGFPTILAAWAEKGWPEPELEEDTILNQVTLSLKMNSNDTNESQETSKSANGTHSGTQTGTHSGGEGYETQIRSMIKANNKITRKQIAEALSVSLRTVQRILNSIDGLRYIGSGRGGHWEYNGDDK